MLDREYTKQHIENVHDLLTFLVETIASQPDQQGYRNAVAKLRKIDVCHFDRINAFYVPNEDYLREIVGETNYTNLDLGFISGKGNSPLKERFVFPCYNNKGKVVGLVGYDNLSANYKYLLSTTLGFDKSLVTYGYENLERIYSEDYIIFVEGIMDYFRLLSLGYPVFCLQGVILFDTHLRIAKRVSNTITLLDSDKAGISAVVPLTKVLKRNTNIQINRYGLSKMDADLFLSYPENVKYFELAIDTIKTRWQQLNYNNIMLNNQSEELRIRMEKALKEKLERENAQKSKENEELEYATNT